jgi:hypothetical protein
MIQNLPIYISIVFGLTTFVVLFLFIGVLKNSDSLPVKNKANTVVIGLIIWLILQAVLTLNDVYNTNTNVLPPKILIFGILPTFLMMLVLFSTKYGRVFIDSLPLQNITILNTIRIPVELVLFWLFLNKSIPAIMTFEGRNLDILAGISAPIMAYCVFFKGILSRKVLLFWNISCLGLLINIIVLAFLSAPTPFQQFGFEQSNIGILNFPFSWLPTFIVPIVLFGHLVSIKRLLKSK